MKKTQRKDAIRNIFRKKVSWLSIAIVSMITVGVFLGCRFYRTASARDIAEFVKSHNFKDMDVVTSAGLSQNEIDKLRAVEGVKDVEGYHQIDATVRFDGKPVAMSLIRLTERISTPELVDGKLPEKKGELAISKTYAEKNGVNIGDQVVVTADGNQGKLLATNNYEIVGIVNHPEFLQLRFTSYVLASDASFDTQMIDGGYLRALIRLEYPDDVDIFSSAYYDEIHDTEMKIRDMLPALAEEREKTLRAKAEERLEEEIREPKQKIEKAEKDLEEGKAKLETEHEKLVEGKAEIEKDEPLVKDAEKFLADGKKKLDQAYQEIVSGERTLFLENQAFLEKKAAAEKMLKEAEKNLGTIDKKIQKAETMLSQAELALKAAAQKKGMKDLPKDYYDLKERVKGYYQPAMNKMVETGKEDTSLIAKAEKKAVKDVVETYKKSKSLQKMANAMTYKSVLGMLSNLYPDTKAADLVKQGQILAGSEDSFLIPLREYLKKQKSTLTVSELYKKMDSDPVMKKWGQTEVTKMGKNWENILAKYFSGVGSAGAARAAITLAYRTLNAKKSDVLKLLAAGKAKLDEGEKQLNEGKAKYAEGQKTYQQKQAEYTEGKKELESGKQKYEDGLKQYNEGEKKYEEGKKEYEVKKAEFDKKVAEEREKMLLMTESHFIDQDRRANLGFVNATSNMNTIGGAANAFIVLFLLIGGMVIFSTIVIIVDEQKVLSGAMKSLGFFNSAIRSKYLVYGLSAVITGILTGILLSFAIQAALRIGIDILYVTGKPGFAFQPVLLVVAAVLEICVAVFATFIACSSMLKLSAVQLMSGVTKQRSLVGKADSKKKKGSLYSRLIIRNMRTERSRVIVTTVIIAGSCLMIGLGFTLKSSFDGMMRIQLEEIQTYDLRIDYDSDLDKGTVSRIRSTLTDSGVEFASAAEEVAIYRIGEAQEYTYILVMDGATASTYYHITDFGSGEEMTIPDDGVLIQSRLHETKKLDEGDTFILFDTKLKQYEVQVKGVYRNHLGRNLITTPEGYKNLFGKTATDNLIFVRLNGVDGEAVKQKLLEINPNLKFSSPDKYREDYKDMQNSYDMVVYLLTGLALIMSVFVLANLTNIFVSRRTKELITMRVNGFSNAQCRGYLIREMLLTTIIGFVLAIGLGSVAAYGFERVIELNEIMYDRSFQPMAWVMAVLLEGSFAFCINTYAFRKVRKLKVTDINA